MLYESVDKKIKELVGPLFDKKGLELVELTYRKEGRRMVLKFLVDKPSGITIEECAVLNEEIGNLLDNRDTMAASYILEVSSPGLDRPLQTRKDFERMLGKKIEVSLKDAVEAKSYYMGIVDSVNENSVVIRNKEAKLIEIPFNAVNRGKLVVGFDR